MITRVHDVGPIHERSKKLGAHVVRQVNSFAGMLPLPTTNHHGWAHSLGQEQKQWQGDFFSPTFAQDNPYAVFRFMYRPRGMCFPSPCRLKLTHDGFRAAYGEGYNASAKRGYGGREETYH